MKFWKSIPKALKEGFSALIDDLKRNLEIKKGLKDDPNAGALQSNHSQVLRKLEEALKGQQVVDAQLLFIIKKAQDSIDGRRRDS